MRVDCVVDVDSDASSSDVLSVPVVQRVRVKILERLVVEPRLSQANNMRRVVGHHGSLELVPLVHD